MMATVKIGNWTLTDGISTVYDSLGVDVRRLNHFRVVTIIVGLLLN